MTITSLVGRPSLSEKMKAGIAGVVGDEVVDGLYMLVSPGLVILGKPVKRGVGVLGFERSASRQAGGEAELLRSSGLEEKLPMIFFVETRSCSKLESINTHRSLSRKGLPER